MGNRRSACDRCRRHKLRCERGHAVQCRRCEKINAECLTSPALRSGRPQQLSGADDPDIQSFNGPFNGYEELPSVISTLDVSLLPLASPPEINISESDSALPQLISPTNLDDFSHFWPQNFGQNLALAAVPGTVPVTPPSETQGDCLRKLGDLQAAVIGDLENVKSCITADKCPEALDSSDLNPVTSQNIMIGRMLDHSTSLIDILNHFQPHANSAPFELTCDTPTMFVLLSCYIGLVRIYRTILSCVLDCLPILLGIQHPIPQLFPGMNLGGFKLEARLDIQVKILVQISEDMLGKIESRFGLVDNIFQPTGVVLTQGKAARMLSTMLEEEANEQPPLYQPRGHCDSLRSILDRLKNSV
ncbi:hypothetical protein N7533_003046 [Penicillium manginii]|uniref:uncharacterized protein n=1 Tax=Penicillium manginii TaxID=203109 RepID=UPI002546D1A2|nr:uncharacterized protein N7533_003046 [Penicillium manginii]KAJ5764365.1 hypothetical protein N7533_003046 [Penicillium manginii]